MTTPPSSPRAEDILIAALDHAPEDREAFLTVACSGDEVLLAEVRGLLAAHLAAPTEFLGSADAHLAATIQMRPEPNRATPAAEQSGDRIGPYKLLQEIGEGGFGTVWMADQEKPVRRRVALKIVKLGMDTKEVVARFEQERQALAMMDHPNIARVFDAGATEQGRPFFVMELVRGVKITDYCDDKGLPNEERIELFIQVCQAVQHAHQKGIIHRDLKPSNILVTVNDGRAVPKVIDFGVAKATQGKLADGTLFTQFEQMIGTPLYMSPEQAEMTSVDVDTRSDIYSLGVLLYELLTGRTPIDMATFARAGLGEIRRIIREVDPVRPSARLKTLDGNTLSTTAKRRHTDPAKLPGTLRGDIDWIVMKCLEKDRARRYDTANSLALDLRRHLQNEVVIARPPTAGYLLGKLVRRNKLAFAAGTAIAASLVIGIAASAWQAVRATRAEREQSQLREVAEKALDGEKMQRAEAEAERQRAESNAEKARSTAIKARRSQYAADLFAATTQIERGGFLTARNSLREYFPREGMEELRGFEWRYWWQLSAGQQLKTLPVSGSIRDMTWSPDGQLIAASNMEGSVKLLRPATGEMVMVLKDCAGFNPSLAFSHDGRGLATAGNSKNVPVVCFWDVRDGRLLFKLTGYPQPRVACSPAGPLMAIGTGGDWWAQSGGEVHLVDTTSGKVVRVLPKSGDRAAFSRDGKRIATANHGAWSSGSQAVILWNVDSGEKLSVLENQRQVLSMAFSPDGRVLAISTRNGQVTLWNLQDFSHGILREATKDCARSVAFSPDGQRLAVGLQTHEVEIWDMSERRRVETLRGHTGEVSAVGYLPDGTQLASACMAGTIRLWDPNPATVPKLIPGTRLAPSFGVGHPRFSPDSRLVAVAMQNGDVQIVDPATADWNVRKVLPSAGFPVAFSGVAATLLTLGADCKTVHRWEVASGAKLTTTPLNASEQAWSRSAATSEGDRLALAAGKLIEVHDTRAGRRLASFQSPTSVNSLEFSSDGALLAIGGHDNGVLWEIAANRAVWTAVGHRARITSIRFSPDQKTIATTSWDATVRLWGAATGAPLATLTGHKAGVLNSIFSPDGRTLVTGSDDRTIRFWNLATLHEVASIQLSHSPSCFAFSADGQILLTNSGDSSLRCWRAPSLAEIDAAEAKDQAESTVR
jgi:WD40 repeat protein/serine/threonine protein kinase